MISILYAIVIVFLFWAPAGLFLHGFYSTKYQDLDELRYNLDRDMKVWAPAVGALLALLLSHTVLVSLCIVGLALEAYLVYFEKDGSLIKFRRYLDDKDNK
tara:strand:+ start:451 stop:753 length:303 start_codon:yes stop_codon:yes gene_type:complete